MEGRTGLLGYCDRCGDCCRVARGWTTPEEIDRLGFTHDDFYLSERYRTPDGDVLEIFKPKITGNLKPGVSYSDVEEGRTDRLRIEGECIYLDQGHICSLQDEGKKPMSCQLFFCRTNNIQAEEMQRYRSDLGLSGARMMTAEENRELAETETVAS